MEDEVGRDTIGIDTGKGRVVALGQGDNAQDEGQEQNQYRYATHKSLLLTDGAVDKVGMLFGHIFQFGLSAVQEALARETAATDGDFALVDVVARSA